jgi:DNA-binding ferritin-like protein
MEFKLYDMAVASFLFRSDLHCLHHNVSGVDFKDTHEWLSELYDKALEDFDFAMEHAILTKELKAAPNMIEVLQSDHPIIKNWYSVSGNTLYPVEEALKKVQEVWEDYNDILYSVRTYCEREGWSDIVSDLDSIISFWSLEVQYKIERTLE